LCLTTFHFIRFHSCLMESFCHTADWTRLQLHRTKSDGIKGTSLKWNGIDWNERNVVCFYGNLLNHLIPLQQTVSLPASTCIYEHRASKHVLWNWLLWFVVIWLKQCRNQEKDHNALKFSRLTPVSLDSFVNMYDWQKLDCFWETTASCWWQYLQKRQHARLSVGVHRNGISVSKSPPIRDSRFLKWTQFALSLTRRIASNGVPYF
jgi:hypothetical protein